MSKQTKIGKGSKSDKNMDAEKTAIATRTLRSNTKQSEIPITREIITKRKRTIGLSTESDVPKSKLSRHSTASKESEKQLNRPRRHTLTRAKQVDKMNTSKSKPKNRPRKRGKSNNRKKLAHNNKTLLTRKRSNRMLSKSSQRKPIDDTSISTRQKEMKMAISPARNKTRYLLMKDKSVVQNKKKFQGKNVQSQHFPPREQCIRVVGKINTDLKLLVSTICCVDESTMWIGRQAYDRLIKVEYNENGIQRIIKEFPFPMFAFSDFCFDKEYNQLFICDRTERKLIMTISPKYEKIETKSFPPLRPTCITISENFIYVGLVHAYAYDCGEVDPRHIIKMDRNWTVHQRIDSLLDGSRNFLFTHRCIVNPVSRDLVVVGHKSSNEACIANFNEEGINGFLYFGKRFDTPFVPRGLACSSQGNILVCNEYNGDIHILNKIGQCLSLMDMKTSGLPEKPWSFAWDLFGHLLIGTMTDTTGNILITEYTDLPENNEYPLV